MPYSSAHTEATRTKIVQSARRLFNRKGLSEVSIDEIMGAAGLTRGGFYNHFSSKEELYALAIRSILDDRGCDTAGTDQQCSDVDTREIVQNILNAYLSQSHFDSVDNLCPMIALPSDVARGGDEAKGAYQMVVERLVGMFEQSLAQDGGDARERALGLVAMCVGGMVIARAVNCPDFATEIRDAARQQAMCNAGLQQKPMAAE